MTTQLDIICGTTAITKDLMRASIEAQTAFWTWPIARAMAQTGHGQPVMTLPGFTAPEKSLAPLNRFLRQKGFYAKSWGQGTNHGPKDADEMALIMSRVLDRLEAMKKKTGRKVSLVGQSLGGVYSYEIAKAAPELIERVITLGSPTNVNLTNYEDVNKAIGAVMSLKTGKTIPEQLAELETLPDQYVGPPQNIPVTSIWSELDGVVGPSTTIIEHKYESKNPYYENLEILSSHCGMAISPIALIAIADRLVVHPDHWQDFNPDHYFHGPLKPIGTYFYPRP